MKRLIDFVLACVLCVLAAPVMATTAVAVRILLGAPVLFRQERTGYRRRSFDIVKFRTMVDLTDEHGVPLPDHERRHWFGDFLRRTSLDELPALLNIIAGDMSIVGPRPLLHRYLPRYNERQIRRFETRPGFTGLAQVSGRNAVDWDTRLELDVRYVETRSLALDLSIISKTVRLVLGGDGADGIDHTTEFFGSQDPSGGSTESVDVSGDLTRRAQ